MKDLGQLIREPGKHGWRVTGFYQLASGRWRCALSGPEARCLGGIEYEEGDTPEEAVSAALQDMHVARARGRLSLETEVAHRVWEAAQGRLRAALKGLGL